MFSKTLSELSGVQSGFWITAKSFPFAVSSSIFSKNKHVSGFMVQEPLPMIWGKNTLLITSVTQIDR